MPFENRFAQPETRQYTTDGNTIEQGAEVISFRNSGASDASWTNENGATGTIPAGEIVTLSAGSRPIGELTVDANGTTVDALIMF